MKIPAIPLYSKLIPLRTVVSMLAGNMFHHLYSKPSTGSVPTGQLMQPGMENKTAVSGPSYTYARKAVTA